MKGMKKLLSILVVLTLVLSLGTSAMAATVTIGDDGSYSAYQIFKGNYGNKVNGVIQPDALGDITWGDGINQAGFIQALKDEGITITDDEAPTVAKAIFDAVPGTISGAELADIVYANLSSTATMTGITSAMGSVILPEGYYLFVDTTGGADGYYNHALLQLTGDSSSSFTIAQKANAPSLVKQIQDDEDADWVESADWDIGDHVPFQLTATTPSEGEGYQDYKIIFHDTLSDGLTLDNDTANPITITINGQTYDVPDATNGITLDQSGQSFSITVDDVMKFFTAPATWTNKAITVEYTATLNDDAVIGGTGNPNTAYLEYDNNPNDESGADNTTHSTTPSQVTVFTFELDVKKVYKDAAGDDQALQGAGFTLYKWDPTLDDGNGDWVQIEVKPAGTATEFTFEGLDDGKYKLVESTVPDGFNKADDIVFTVTADHVNAPTPAITALTVTVTSMDANDDPNATFTTSASAGTMSTTVLNQRGVELPETGGIGTTIFYVAGAILVAGALILLVTKKRVNGTDK